MATIDIALVSCNSQFCGKLRDLRGRGATLRVRGNARWAVRGWMCGQGLDVGREAVGRAELDPPVDFRNSKVQYALPDLLIRVDDGESPGHGTVALGATE
jgi:hypothetical protein